MVDLRLALRESYLKGRELLNADNGKLLRQRRIALYKQFKNIGDCSKLPLNRLRFYAKRFGISMAGKMRNQKLIMALKSLENSFIT